MAEHQIAIELREGVGKGTARKLRAAGRIPAVFYGEGESHPISLEPRFLERLLASSAAGLNTLIDLKGGGPLEGKRVLVKDLQRDPVRGELLHADLYAIDVTQVVHVQVPIHLKGTPRGVSLGGGILDHVIRELELECLPTAIPEELPLDITGLEMGDTLHVRDIPLPPGVTLLTDDELSVASVVQPRVEEEAPIAEEDVEVAAAEADADAAPEEAPADEAAGEAGGKD